jgi:hypothetical protein
MRAHSDTRSKLKYLAYFPVQGVFRASGMDITELILDIVTFCVDKETECQIENEKLHRCLIKDVPCVKLLCSL